VAYSGEWRDDKMEGPGVMRYADGTVCEGTWRNNRQHGRGKIVWPRYPTLPYPTCLSFCHLHLLHFEASWSYCATALTARLVCIHGLSVEHHRVCDG
jgi:hypothetical protein